MALDQEKFDALLNEAQAHADRAEAENNPRLYREAFAASLEALRLLGEESGAWRQAVARATEEFEGSEGI